MFPPASHANEEGLLAVGGKLREDWLLTAYAQGIFPWYTIKDIIFWYSPDPRMVLFPDEVHIARSMRPMLNNPDYAFRLDSAFDHVIEICASIPRSGQPGTWIDPKIISAYKALHRIGMAHSAEIWYKGELVGGLYGVSIGAAFFGESMFSKISGGSKLALIRLSAWLRQKEFNIIDCQTYSQHLETMGGRLIPRKEFLNYIDSALLKPSLKGKWNV